MSIFFVINTLNVTGTWDNILLKYVLVLPGNTDLLFPYYFLHSNSKHTIL